MSSSKGFLVLVLLVTACFAQNKFNNYGQVLNGYPRWQERATHAIVNIARMSPTNYKAFFTPTLTNAPMTPTRPIYEHYDLIVASRYHCDDMNTNKCFSHNSCDGTDTFVRIGRYYKESGTLAENIAQGQSSPQAVVAAWIIDAGVPGAGHRVNIMNSAYTVMGNGWTTNNYWTQDFGGGPNGASNYPISAGAHFFLNSTHITFIANIYNSTHATAKLAPKSVALLLNGTVYEMKINNKWNYNDDASIPYGTYSVTLPKTIASATVCRNYNVIYVDPTGTQYVYPQQGQLQVQAESNGCTTFYTSANPILPSASSLPTNESATKSNVAKLVVMMILFVAVMVIVL